MCLYTLGNTNIPKVAASDITVYKVGKACKLKLFGLTWEYFRPYFRNNFKYTKNHKQPKIKLNPTRDWVGVGYKIEEGYHAYVKAQKYYKTMGVFIIPKGTKYFLGANGDIVAETMVYKGNIKNNIFL